MSDSDKQRMTGRWHWLMTLLCASQLWKHSKCTYTYIGNRSCIRQEKETNQNQYRSSFLELKSIQMAASTDCRENARGKLKHTRELLLRERRRGWASWGRTRNGAGDALSVVRPLKRDPKKLTPLPSLIASPFWKYKNCINYKYWLRQEKKRNQICTACS